MQHAHAAAKLSYHLTQQQVPQHLIEADFSQPGEATRTVAQAQTCMGVVDKLVECASMQQREAFAKISATALQRQIPINFEASVALLQAAAVPGMKQRGWGRILTIDNFNQTRRDPELAIYAALMSAQHNLTLNLAHQLASFDVSANNLSPGLVATARNQWRRVDAGQ